MSFLDKLVAVVTPPETDAKRMDARAEARTHSHAGDWLSNVIEHHEQIEHAFEQVRSASDAGSRRTAQKRLAVLLTAHANAEETVLYPELADRGHKAHAGTAYEEQAMTKIQLALLDKLEPMSQDYLDKLEHIRGAVTHHMYQEESSWLLDLKRDVPGSHQTVLGERYREEMGRYLGTDR
jgi:hemerythrin superfamily protein